MRENMHEYRCSRVSTSAVAELALVPTLVSTAHSTTELNSYQCMTPLVPLAQPSVKLWHRVQTHHLRLSHDGG